MSSGSDGSVKAGKLKDWRSNKNKSTKQKGRKKDIKALKAKLQKQSAKFQKENNTPF